jgi:hypothetical protein
MISFNLPTNFIDDLEVLLKRTKAKLKRVSALESKDNRIRRSLTPEFEAMANKSFREFSAPTTANIRTGCQYWRQWIRAQACCHQYGASQLVLWKGT